MSPPSALTLEPHQPSLLSNAQPLTLISSINNIGLEATRSKWQAHWSKALSESDLNYLSAVAHCTTIRLPIGYFTLGPAFCANTPFAMGPSQVYVNAWSAVCNLVHRCHAHGIGVLLNLHACPGGANAEAHSGTSSGQAELWGNEFSLSLANRCLVFVAQEVKNRGLVGVVGIQICNEAIYDAPGMYDFYDDVIKAISAIDSTIPIYISDGWDLARALEYCIGKNTTRSTTSSGRKSAPARNPVVADTHRYYTFSAHDTSRSPEQIIEQISSPSELSELDAKQGNVLDHHGAVGVFVGEWSCTLAPSTWAQVPEAQREGLVKQFADVQAKKWRDKGPGVGGSAFWTFKMAWGGSKGGEWGFREQVDTGAVAAPTWSRLTCGEVRTRLKAAEKRRQGMMAGAMEEHEEYWRRTAGKDAYFEHWRFGAGWHLGWCDARDFFAARGDGVLPSAGADDGQNEDTVWIGADRIGFLDLWILKRMRDQGLPDKDAKGAGFGWEWEQGFRRGLEDFEHVGFPGAAG